MSCPPAPYNHAYIALELWNFSNGGLCLRTGCVPVSLVDCTTWSLLKDNYYSKQQQSGPHRPDPEKPAQMFEAKCI